MPYKGRTRLSDEKRAEIVLAKTLLRDTSDTDRKLANDFNVAEITIKKHNYEMLTDAQKAIYHEKAANLKYDALNLTQAAMRKSLELVGLADDPKQLPGVVAAGKFGYEAHRLETGQPTAITQQESPVKAFVEHVLRVSRERGWVVDVKDVAEQVRLFSGGTAEERERIAKQIENGELRIEN